MKQAKIFQKLTIILFSLFVFVPASCGMLQDTTASIAINLGGGARAVSTEDRASAVFDIYFNENLVGSQVSGNFYAEATVGTTIVVRVEAFVDGKLIAAGAASLYVQSGVNSVNISLREVQIPSEGGTVVTPPPGGGTITVTQIKIAGFDLSKYCKQGDNSIGNFSSGDAAGIAVSNPQDIQGTTFSEGEQLPVPTFSHGTTHTATFVGWVPVDDVGTLASFAMSDFDGKTLIPAIILDPVPTPFVAEIVGGQQYTDFMDAFNYVTADQTLKLLKDVNITRQLSITKNMTLDLNGYSILGDDSFGLIDIQSNKTFTLNDSKGSGREGMLTRGSYGNGAAVYINTNATFNMNGGDITGNTSKAGGAVYLAGTGSKFVMDGAAKITYNTVTEATANRYGGAGVCMYGGTFEMRNGEISNNTVSGSNGSGGGIFMNGGTFTKTGGEVKNNSAPNGANLSVQSGTATGNGATLATTNDAF